MASAATNGVFGALCICGAGTTLRLGKERAKLMA
jgi:hypothetical protein